MSTLGHRDKTWAKLKNLEEGTERHFDIIVVGGGITGAGILREATRQGLKTLLVEQQDFAWGTSSRSSKMVHGGLRYIAQGDILLTRHAALERERLINEAPGLVERMGYLFPIRQGQFPGKFLFNALLTFYDVLAGIKTHGWHDVKALTARAPGIRQEGLKGASYYTDAITDDSRLVLRVLQQCCKEGGQVLNYAEARGLLRNDEGRVNGISLHDHETGENVDVRASVVINATGAWVDQLREEVAFERTIRPLRGSHIIIPSAKIPIHEALTLFHPKDNRATFIFPWEGFTVIGTTDLDNDAPLNNEPGISAQEVNYLLELAHDNFPDANLEYDDIISSFAGVRPVISKDRNKDPSKEKRDHQVWVNQGLVSVSGGKLTTFRLIARDTLEAAKGMLPGVEFANRSEAVLHTPSLKAETLGLKNVAWAKRMIGRYGDAAREMLSAVPEHELAPLDGTQFCLAELRWSCRNEQIMHLDDLLLRRTRIGLLVAQGGKSIFPAAKDICQQELGWSDTKWDQELARYQTIWRQSYYLPPELRSTTPEPAAQHANVGNG